MREVQQRTELEEPSEWKVDSSDDCERKVKEAQKLFRKLSGAVKNVKIKSRIKKLKISVKCVSE